MILLIFFAMNNAGLVLVIYFNVLLRKTQVSLRRISTSFQKNAKLFMLPFLHKNDKIQISQFSVKNKQIFKIIVFHTLT